MQEGELSYNNNTGVEKAICKKDNMRMLNPTQIPVGLKVKEAKIADVGNLLEKHFGKKLEGNQDLAVV
ncbi:hypothetical protein WA026_013605 [Henosepilachna vigintioctopunctata]|uniref:Uncharacterized protein n=1 Tax=Henosepilachna vigintioctopunctata TaxID=420089 RepID=A0AAW1VCR9_9CUCU